MRNRKNALKSTLMRRMALIANLVVFSTLSTHLVGGEIDFQALERIAIAELEENRIPGAAIAVVLGDKVAFAKGFGVANVETGAPMTTNTLFRIGSMTKVFTAAAIVATAEGKSISLNEPIGTHLKRVSASLASITTHQLLSHTAGIRDEASHYGAHEESALLSAVASWGKDYLFTEPGQVFSYANPGYAVAGAVLEGIARRPYADAMNEAIFSPVGMTNSTFRPTEAITYSLAQGHHVQENGLPLVVRPFTDNVVHWPAGFMFSTAHDLALFATVFVNDGKLGAKQVLPASVIRKLGTPHAEVPGLEMKYGYGLKLTRYRGINVVEHGGAIPGFGSELKMVPEHRFAIIVLCNKSGARLPKTVTKAFEMTLRLKAEQESSKKPFIKLTAGELDRYVGKYANSPRNSMEIVRQEQRLFFKRGNAMLPLDALGSHLFFLRMREDSEPEEIAFVVDRDGKAKYLHFNGRAFVRP